MLRWKSRAVTAKKRAQDPHETGPEARNNERGRGRNKWRK